MVSTKGKCFEPKENVGTRGNKNAKTKMPGGKYIFDRSAERRNEQHVVVLVHNEPIDP